MQSERYKLKSSILNHRFTGDIIIHIRFC